MSVLARRIRAHSPAYVVLAILFVFASAQWVRTTSTSVDYILHGEELVRDPFLINPLTGEAVGRTPEAEAAGFGRGDLVIAVNGHPVHGLSDLYGVTRRARLGDVLRVRVRSTTAAGPIEKDLSIQLSPFRYLELTKAGSPAFPWVILPSILLPLSCILPGFWVLLLMLLLGFANIITEGRVLLGYNDALQPLLTSFAEGFKSLGPAALVLFALVFPDRLSFDRRFPWIKWLVIGPLLFVAAVSTAIWLLLPHHLTLAQRLPLIGPVDTLESYMDPAAYVFFDEWGEERMIDTVSSHRTSSAKEMIQRLMTAADAFVAGAPQYDDMTLTVVRVI